MLGSKLIDHPSYTYTWPEKFYHTKQILHNVLGCDLELSGSCNIISHL